MEPGSPEHKVSYVRELVAVGCNKVCGALTWARGRDLIAYGAGSMVAILNPQSSSLDRTLAGHGGRVNVVRWAVRPWEGGEEEEGHPPAYLPERFLVSGGADGLVLVWECGPTWSLSAALKGHSAPVSALATLDLGGSTWVASSSADGTVRLWRHSGLTWALVQVLVTGLCEAVALAPLPQGPPLLICGGVDSTLRLYAWHEDADPQADPWKQVGVLKGHADWVRVLAVAWHPASPELLIASGAQDRRVRLWKICPVSAAAPHTPEAELRALTTRLEEGALDEVFEEFARGHADVTLKVGCAHWAVHVDAVLTVHEDWVHGLDWAPLQRIGRELTQPRRLLTASMDKTLLVWAPDSASALWARLGEVGGNLQGFMGGCWSPTGRCLVAHGYTGALHRWEQGAGEGAWQPLVTPGGHGAAVRDLAWGEQGALRYLLTCSDDTTVRCWAPWGGGREAEGPLRWHEVARPQVHGHEMRCLTSLGLGRYASGADEKVVRVFEAPQSFLLNLASISRLPPLEDSLLRGRPLSAQQPPLGLSNKPLWGTAEDEALLEGEEQRLAAYGGGGEDGEGPPSEERGQVHPPLRVDRPPYEEELLQRSLWAEVQKLYGHANELVAVAAQPSGRLLASAAKSKVSTEHAAVRLWDTTTWRTVAVLALHKSTVTSLAWSPDGLLLASVSKGRSLAVVRLPRTTAVGGPSSPLEPVLLAKGFVATRMLLAASWSPSGRLLATGARDSKTPNLKVFVINEDLPAPQRLVCVASLTLPSGVASLSWAPSLCGGAPLLAVGLESGELSLWRAKEDALPSPPTEGGLPFTLVCQVDAQDAPADSVRVLSWAPWAEGGGLLAAAGDDHALRLFRFRW